MKRIGYISASIAGDERYSTYIELISNGEFAQVRARERRPVGGMDGPGGSHLDESWTVLTEVLATPRSVVDAIWTACSRDIVIDRYGKPSKNWRWVEPGTYRDIAQGISLKKAAQALAQVSEKDADQ